MGWARQGLKMGGSILEEEKKKDSLIRMYS